MESVNEQLWSGENIIWPKNCERLEVTASTSRILTNKRYFERKEDFKSEMGIVASAITTRTDVQVSEHFIIWSLGAARRILLTKGSRPGFANIVLNLKVGDEKWWRPAFFDVSSGEYKEFKSRLKKIHPKFARLVRDVGYMKVMLHGGLAAIFVLIIGLIMAAFFGPTRDLMPPFIDDALFISWLTIGLESFVTGITWLIIIRKVFWGSIWIARTFFIWLIFQVLTLGVGLIVFTADFFPSSQPWAISVFVAGCVLIGGFWSVHAQQLKRAENFTLFLHVLEGVSILGIAFLFMILFTSDAFGAGLSPDAYSTLIFLIPIQGGFVLFDTLSTRHINKREDEQYSLIYLKE